jgi:phage shock protein C
MTPEPAAPATIEAPQSRRTFDRGVTPDMATYFAQRGLVRPRDDRVIAGVCAGLGRRFGLSPWVARILFILLLMIIPGSQLIVYPILWVLMPSER